MKRKLIHAIVWLLIVSACREDDIPEPTEYGYLSMQIALNITSEEASGRVDAVDTDNFRVTIFDASGTEIMVFDPFSSAPAEVALPTGEYYVEAHSNNLVDAAFENPYYYGRSANFTIDKEETTAIDIDTELANTKVAILYSDEVVNTFTSYTGTVTVISTGSSLFYDQGETREGYFITSPLEVEVELRYTKLDGSTIDRIYTAVIDDPQPKTLYNINVDAALEDGVIVFNITVDESFDTVDIVLGDALITPSLLWNKNYGGSSYDWIRGSDGTSDGGIIMVGASASTDGNATSNKGRMDGLIIKVDQSGNVEWSRSIGGSRDDMLNDVHQALDGGYIIIGTTWSYDYDLTGVTTMYGNGDYWVIKLDASGNVEWQKSYGGGNGDQGIDIYPTSDNGYIFTGRSISYNGDVSVNMGSDDMWVVKVDPLGNIEWEKSIGGSAFDVGFEIIQTQDGNYLMTGQTDSNDGDVSGNSGQTDAFLIKFNQSTTLWSKTFGGSLNDYGRGVYETQNQNIIFNLYANSPEVISSFYGGTDPVLMEFDPNGNLIQQKNFGGTLGDGFGGIQEVSDGYIIAGGARSSDIDLSTNYGRSDAWILKISKDFEVLYSQTYGGTNDDGVSEIYLGSNSFFAVGTTNSSNVDVSNPLGIDDFWLLKFQY